MCNYQMNRGQYSKNIIIHYDKTFSASLFQFIYILHVGQGNGRVLCAVDMLVGADSILAMILTIPSLFNDKLTCITSKPF